MEYAQNFDLGFTYPIRDQVRQAGDHQFARSENPACPTGGGVRDKHGFGALHQLKDNATGGCRTILADVLGDVVEILASEL